MTKKIITTMIVLIAVFALTACGGRGEEESADAGEDTSSTAADATSRPTEMTADAGNVQDALGPDGSWIVIFTDDVTVGEELTVSGEVYEEEGAEAPRRKIALYEQDADRNVTARHTLTTPRLIIDHENTLIQAGEVAGDVFVNAAGFALTGGATINGNLYFATEELRDGADIGDDSTVMGEIRIGAPADAVSRPTQLTATDAVFEGDVSTDSDVVIAGAVYEEEGAEAPRRKLALYAQDADRNVTARYTLAAPRVIVHHLNTLVQAGTIAGDVYVEEEGFQLSSGATIDGDLFFADEALQASASISDDSTVTGEVGIATVD